MSRYKSTKRKYESESDSRSIKPYSRSSRRMEPSRSMRAAADRTVVIQCKTFNNLNVTASSATGVFGVVVFQLNDLIDVASYIGVWDQYRIRKIKVFVDITQQGLPTTSPSMAHFVTVCDTNDDVTPTSINQLMNYHDSYIHPKGQTSVRTIRPKPSSYLRTGSTDPAGMPPNTQWIDVRYPDVKYVSLKYGWSQATTTSVFLASVYYQYFVEFKSTR